MVSRQQKGWTKAHTHILASRDRVREMSAGSKQDKCNVALALTSWWAETRQESSQQAVDRTNEGQHSHSGKQRQCKREVSKQWRGQTRDSTHKLASRDEVREITSQKTLQTSGGTYKLTRRQGQQQRGLTSSRTHKQPHKRKCSHTFTNYFLPVFLPTSKHCASPKAKMRCF